MKLSIRAKLLGLVAIASLAVLAVTGTALRLNYERMRHDRVEALRFVAEAGISLAGRLEEAAVAGRMSREEAQARFKHDLVAMRYNGKEYMFAFTRDLVMFAHPSEKLLGSDVSKIKDRNGLQIAVEMARLVQERGQGIVQYEWQLAPDKPETGIKLGYAKAFEPWGLIISTGVFVDDIWAEFMKQLRDLAIAVGLVALPAIALIALVGVKLSSAIRRLSAKMRTLATGDLSVSFPEAERGDEIGAMAQAVQVFKTNAEEKARLEAEQAASAQQAEAEKRRTLERMAERFEQTVGGVIRAVSQETEQMQREARDMTGAAEETDALATAVAAATEETSTNVQTVAAATEQLTSSIGEISRQVTEASRIAGEAVATSERANGKVAGLAEAVEKIGAVVDLIHNIASQTNLLALNATIEAARAGDAGKGFAVVASEVKQLATQTAKATEEIGTQVASIQAATGDAVGEIQSVGQVIGRVSEISTRIASAVEEQGAATNEISRNVQQAAEGTRAVASKIAGVTAAADQSGRMAGKVLDGSRHLAAQAETLNTEVGSFLRSLRLG